MSKLYDYNRNTQTDEFGVCHKDFSLRDEIEYNFQRAKERERQQCLMPQNMQVPQKAGLQSMPETNWNSIIAAGIAGMGEGMTAGINRGLNAASFGLYGRAADAILDNIYTNQHQRLQSQAEQVGLGNFNKLANKAIDVGSQLPMAKFLKL